MGPGGRGVYLDFAEAITQFGRKTIAERYGNLFDMYQRITGESAYEQPMRIYPAVHYTMGGLWVDYNLMSNLPGLHVVGPRANFSDHGANRLGASALMQGLADGLLCHPHDHRSLSGHPATRRCHHQPSLNSPKAIEDCNGRIRRFLGNKGKRTVDSFHRELGLLVWDKCGMARGCRWLAGGPAPHPGIARGVSFAGAGSRQWRGRPTKNSRRRGESPTSWSSLNCSAAMHLPVRESCGGHFRTEHQYPDGEAKRDDENFCHVAAWGVHRRLGQAPTAPRGPALRGGPPRRAQL